MTTPLLDDLRHCLQGRIQLQALVLFGSAWVDEGVFASARAAYQGTKARGEIEFTGSVVRFR